jgi:hypothetical protein
LPESPVGKCLAKPVVTFRKKAPPVFRPFVDLFRRITGNYEPMIRSMTNMRCLALSRKAVYADSAENSAIIKVEATPVDNDPTDVLTVNYHVTGGKIVGTGRSVVWDLSGVAPGTYYIVAAADDGCGVCGTTITMEIQVKEKNKDAEICDRTGNSGAGNLSAEELQGISQTSCGVLQNLGPQIQWLESFVTNDKVYCVYIAPNEEMIREHARRGGFPANRISEIRSVIDPTTAEISA